MNNIFEAVLMVLGLIIFVIFMIIFKFIVLGIFVFITIGGMFEYFRRKKSE